MRDGAREQKLLIVHSKLRHCARVTLTNETSFYMSECPSSLAVQLAVCVLLLHARARPPSLLSALYSIQACRLMFWMYLHFYARICSAPRTEARQQAPRPTTDWLVVIVPGRAPTEAHNDRL